MFLDRHTVSDFMKIDPPVEKESKRREGLSLRFHLILRNCSRIVSVSFDKICIT